jgi:hypothetical protein
MFPDPALMLLLVVIGDRDRDADCRGDTTGDALDDATSFRNSALGEKSPPPALERAPLLLPPPPKRSLVNRCGGNGGIPPGPGP